MTDRIDGPGTHLVGSLPFADAEQAMRESLTRLGSTLRYLTDGETGERGNYIQHLVERLAANPGLVARETTVRLSGQPETGTEFSRKRGAKLEIPLGELGYHRDWSASLATFRKLREEVARPELRYQMCLAPALSIAIPFFSKPRGVLQALGPLKRALRAEIAEAVRRDADVLVVQLDAAIEQILLAQLHRYARPLAGLAAGRLARQLADLVRDVPAAVPVGVHLCLGNPRNARVVTPPSSEPVVLFANALARAWPAARPLDYLHLPIVDSRDARYYAPLRELRLAPETRLIAGLVYEDGPVANAERLRLARQSLGFTPDVACACGMGRRTPEVARQLLDEMKALAGSRV